jgi:trigger factor
VKTHGLQPTPQQVRAFIEDQSRSFEQPEQLVKWYYGDPSRLAEVEAVVMEDNVVEWGMKNMKVTDEPKAFDDLMAAKKD